MVNRVGFFRELRHGDPDGPSLRASVGRGEPTRREILHRYLVSGTVLAAASAPRVDDALDPSKVSVAPLHVLTDGEWVWPADLAYYVRDYDVELPDRLIQRIVEADGKCPLVDHADLLAIADELWGSDD